MERPRGTLRLQTLAHAFRQSGVLNAAIKLDLFTVVAQEIGETSRIARETGLSQQNAQKLLDVCSSLGLLECRDGRYHNAPDVERYLVKGKEGYAGPWLTNGEEQFKHWADIAPLLKGERPATARGKYEAAWTSVEAARRLNQSTYSIGLRSGYSLARRWDFSARSLLLDLGGGSGCYSIAICSTHPHMKAIIVDYPTVCASAEEFIAEAGLSERITTHPGDLLEVDLPRGADAMLMSSNLPDFSSGALATVYGKAFGAMEKGGAIIILGEALNDDRSGPLEPALWNLDDALSGGHGDSHTISEVCQLLTDAGFVDCEASEYVPGLLTMFVAHKVA